MEGSGGSSPRDETGPAQGPVVEFKRRPKQITARFLKLMDELRAWRSEDHEDTTVLHRNQIIEIIEGVDALTEGAKSSNPQ